METDLSALIAAGAASVAVCAHGIVGHRWFMAQLRSVESDDARLLVSLRREDLLKDSLSPANTVARARSWQLTDTNTINAPATRRRFDA